MNTPTDTPTKNLSPKKLIVHGFVWVDTYIRFEVNTFQELGAVHTTRGLAELFSSYFGVESQATDIMTAFDLYAANPNLLDIRTRVNHNGVVLPSSSISSNGGIIPSCSVIVTLPNPNWNSQALRNNNWCCSFEYRKGKWRFGSYPGDFSLPFPGVTAAPLEPAKLNLIDLIRASKEEI